MASVSRRVSLKWASDEPTETTRTIVLSSTRTGYFIDVRFTLNTSEIDWAFAGVKSTIPNSNISKFTHHIDSRNPLDPRSVLDEGVFTSLPNGTDLETGTMVHPAIGLLSSYEEVWADDAPQAEGLFMRTKDAETWQARVGDVQIALGRNAEGDFWAWQARQIEGEWEVEYFTAGVEAVFLPENLDVRNDDVEWAGKRWVVLDVVRPPAT